MPGTELLLPNRLCARQLACSVGIKGQSTTGRRSFDKSTSKPQQHTTMRSNSPMGRSVMLTHLSEGQAAKVLQLPAQPATAAEAEAQKRVAHVG